MQAQYGDQVTFIGVAGRDSLDASRDFVEGRGVDAFLHLYDENVEIWRGFGIMDQPAWVLINQDGQTQVIVSTLGVDGITEIVEALIEA